MTELSEPGPGDRGAGGLDDGDAAIVDARETRCPMPVIMAAKAAQDLPDGARLVVLATDPAAAADLPAWCRLRGHTLLDLHLGDEVRADIRLGT